MIAVNGSDSTTIHVFHLDLPAEAVERFVTQAGTGEWPLKYALGAKALKASFVDVVAIKDLGDMRLSQYLTQAHNIPAKALDSHLGALNGLRGHVLVLPPPAFEKISQELTVAVPLRHIGGFAEAAPRSRGPKLRSAAAAPGGGAASPKSPARVSPVTRLVLLGLFVLILLLVALLLR